MQRLQHTAARGFSALLRPQPTTAAKVAFAWKLAAGPALGRAGTPEWADEGTLRVRARNEVWLREMRHARPLILERITELLGAGVVRRFIIE